MAFKARRITKEKRIRVWAYLNESRYKELLLYKLGCEEEWETPVTMKELVEEMINGLMDDDREFVKWKKQNPDLVEKVQSGEYEDEPDEDETPKEQEPEPEEEVAEVLEKDAPEPEQETTETSDEERNSFHRRWGGGQA